MKQPNANITRYRRIASRMTDCLVYCAIGVGRLRVMGTIVEPVVGELDAVSSCLSQKED